MKPPKFIFSQQAFLKPFTGLDSSGQKVYTIEGATLNEYTIVSVNPNTGEILIRCRFEPKSVTSRSRESDDKSYVGSVFILGEFVPPQSTFIFEGKKFITGECIQHFDTSGISYLEVMLT